METYQRPVKNDISYSHTPIILNNIYPLKWDIQTDFYNLEMSLQHNNEIKIKEDRRGIFERNVEILEADLRLKKYEREMTS